MEFLWPLHVGILRPLSKPLTPLFFDSFDSSFFDTFVHLSPTKCLLLGLEPCLASVRSSSTMASVRFLWEEVFFALLSPSPLFSALEPWDYIIFAGVGSLIGYEGSKFQVCWDFSMRSILCEWKKRAASFRVQPSFHNGSRTNCIHFIPYFALCSILFISFISPFSRRDRSKDWRAWALNSAERTSTAMPRTKLFLRVDSFQLLPPSLSLSLLLFWTSLWILYSTSLSLSNALFRLFYFLQLFYSLFFTY